MFFNSHFVPETLYNLMIETSLSESTVENFVNQLNSNTQQYIKKPTTKTNTNFRLTTIRRY